MEDFVPTRAAQLRNNPGFSHVCSVYEAPKKKVVKDKIPFQNMKKEDIFDEEDEEDSDSKMYESNEPISDKRKQELEMKKLRWEVMKFGVSGFELKEARKLRMQMAISLGAKPPKNRNKNYKKLQIDRKSEKLKKEEDKLKSGFDTIRVKNFKKQVKNKSKVKDNKSKGKDKIKFIKKNKDEILNAYGKANSINKKQNKFKKKAK